MKKIIIGLMLALGLVQADMYSCALLEKEYIDTEAIQIFDGKTRMDFYFSKNVARMYVDDYVFTYYYYKDMKTKTGKHTVAYLSKNQTNVIIVAKDIDSLDKNRIAIVTNASEDGQDITYHFGDCRKK